MLPFVAQDWRVERGHLRENRTAIATEWADARSGLAAVVSILSDTGASLSAMDRSRVGSVPARYQANASCGVSTHGRGFSEELHKLIRPSCLAAIDTSTCRTLRLNFRYLLFVLICSILHILRPRTRCSQLPLPRKWKTETKL